MADTNMNNNGNGNQRMDDLSDEENPFNDVEQQQNSQQNNNEEQEEKKPKRNIRMSVKSQELIENVHGLDSIFVRMAQKQKMPDIGKPGNEVNDLTKIMNVYKNWHDEYFPKLQFDNFIGNIQRQSGNALVKQRMEYLRRVYKGDETENVPQHLQKKIVVANQTVAPQSSAVDGTQDTKENNALSFLNRQQNHVDASQNVLNNNLEFKVQDDHQQMNAMSTTGIQIDTTTKSARADQPMQGSDLTEEQIKMIELNRQKALEKKRKREQLKQEQEEKEVAEKRKLTEQVFNRAIVDEGLDDSQPMELDENDRQAIMDDLDDYM